MALLSFVSDSNIVLCMTNWISCLSYVVIICYRYFNHISITDKRRVSMYITVYHLTVSLMCCCNMLVFMTYKTFYDMNDSLLWLIIWMQTYRRAEVEINVILASKTGRLRCFGHIAHQGADWVKLCRTMKIDATRSMGQFVAWCWKRCKFWFSKEDGHVCRKKLESAGKVAINIVWLCMCMDVLECMNILDFSYIVLM